MECKQCHAQISAKTVFCPHCGGRFANQAMHGVTGVLVKSRGTTLLSDKDATGRLYLGEMDTRDDLT